MEFLKNKEQDYVIEISDEDTVSTCSSSSLESEEINKNDEWYKHSVADKWNTITDRWTHDRFMNDDEPIRNYKKTNKKKKVYFF